MPGGRDKEYEKIIKCSLPSKVVPKRKVLGKLTQDEINEFRELFELFDTDQSGQVDIFEFKYGIKRTGLLDENICDDLFERMDSNEDGQISIDEFLIFFAKKA